MSGTPEWTVWVLAFCVAALFLFFFWHTGMQFYRYARQLVGTIQNWPQIRRDMTEAEVRRGGRYPLWYRAIRVLLILALAGLAALLVWRKFAGA